jgi:thymidylate kinase
MTSKNWCPVIELGPGITIIVITGGPCSGKTTGLARLKRMLEDRGYKVLVSPESATKLIEAGMPLGELPMIEFQEEILLDILAQEDRIFSIAARYRDKG